MKKIIAMLSVALMGVTAFSSCAGIIKKEKPDNGKLDVISAIFCQYDFARQIAGDKINLTMLIQPGVAIHTFDPSPADIKSIQECDVFIYNGGESDEWAETILESVDTSKMKIVRMMDCVEGMETEEHDHDEDEHAHEEHEEEEHEYDEHIWTSPKNAIKMVDYIKDALCEVDSENKDEYTKNAETYIEKINAVDHEIQSIVDASENKMIIVGDKFPLLYFVKRYGLDYRAAFSGCSSETECSAKTMQYLIDMVNDKKTNAVYHIELSNKNIANAVGEQTGAEVLELHSCHNITKDDFNAGKTYVQLMEQNAENLKKGLK